MDKKKDFKFDKRAENYDEGFEGKLSKRFYGLLRENVRLTKGMALLDAGCGTGTVLKSLADKCEINGYGVDVEKEMIKQAKAKCPQMDIRVCSCDETPFEDGKFDAITACMAYHHFPDKDKFAKEAARLLKKSGRLYIADPKFPLPVRKALNTAMTVHKVSGRFFTANEIAKNFSPFGFRKVAAKSDAYAQIVILEKI